MCLVRVLVSFSDLTDRTFELEMVINTMVYHTSIDMLAYILLEMVNRRQKFNSNLVDIPLQHFMLNNRVNDCPIKIVGFLLNFRNN